MKLGCHCKDLKEWVTLRIYAHQHADPPLMTFALVTQLYHIRILDSVSECHIDTAPMERETLVSIPNLILSMELPSGFKDPS